MPGQKLTKKIGKALDDYGEDAVFGLYLTHGSVRGMLKNMPPNIKAMAKKDHGVISMRVFYAWLKQSPERVARWEECKAIQADQWAEEALEIVDSTDVDEVQVARLRAQTRQWMAEKFNRNQYGKPDVNVAVGIAVGDDFLNSLKKVEQMAVARRAAQADDVIEDAEFEIVSSGDPEE